MQDFIDQMIQHVKRNARERAERTLGAMTAPIINIPGSFDYVRMSIPPTDFEKYCIAQENVAVNRLMQKLVEMSEPPSPQ